ncbi:hypothetical protein DAPPUDRAFT_233163 [Daphnia pulex]|uniref:Uncharacterized protein n=1 Tax=Daphnia pulex TaxID=6669 RepID=E9FTE5_DAPPU|nr:hypothetical protein DAPPUDRAFT_233163 [Daphnia pulex]|eukprot:EFX89651.1 hypothetical protein DAPPUDRAFT_233163 [Daphnia pulex]
MDVGAELRPIELNWMEQSTPLAQHLRPIQDGRKTVAHLVFGETQSSVHEEIADEIELIGGGPIKMERFSAVHSLLRDKEPISLDANEAAFIFLIAVSM